MYKTILLDLGGVLIDVDYHASARAFHALGFTDFDTLYSKARQDHLFDGLETGELSPARFRDRIRQLFRQRRSEVPGEARPDITDREIDACWNAMLGSIAPERITLVERLKERYQVLLLSNTNAIHVPAFETIIAKENGIADFKALFHGAYYSCEMRLRKPHAEAFLHVLNAQGAEPATTLFIDDSIQHVEGARAAGLHAEHLDLAKEDVVRMTERLGLLR
ncbi:MAG TPA: HAD family phosphatase [Flavobacteriales bacterium]